MTSNTIEAENKKLSWASSSICLWTRIDQPIRTTTTQSSNSTENIIKKRNSAGSGVYQQQKQKLIDDESSFLMMISIPKIDLNLFLSV